MSGIARLGDLYGLSPATMAGLADIAGTKPPVDPDSPEAWAAAAAAAGAPDMAAKINAAPAGPVIAASNPNNPAAIAAGVQPDNPAAAEEAKRRQALAEATPQGPAKDSFPTVKSMDPSADPSAAQPLPAAPARVVPAHWQQGSHAVALQHGMRPEELEPGQYHRDVAAGHALLGADKHIQAAQQKGAADATYAAAHALAAKQAQDRIAEINAQKEVYVAKEREKLDRMRAETQKQVDPGAYWKERGDGARIVTALMIGLNQFAVAWRGRGANTSLQIVNEAIDRNIKAQQSNIANAHKSLDAEQNIYARNLAAFGDRERAVLASKMQYLDRVAAMADEQRAKAGSTEAEAGFHDLVAKVNETKAGYADQFAKLTHTQANETMNEHFVPTQVVGGGVPGQKGKEGLYVPTLGGYARDEKAAQELNKKGALRMQIGEDMHAVHSLMDEAKKLSSATPAGYMRLKQIDEEIQSKINDALTKNTVLEGQGAMSESDKQVAAEAKGMKGLKVQWTPNKLIEKKQENLIKAATSVLTQHRLEGEAYGVQKGTEQYVQTPHGPEPVRQLQGRNAAPSKHTQGYDDLVQPQQGVPQKRKE